MRPLHRRIHDPASHREGHLRLSFRPGFGSARGRQCPEVVVRWVIELFCAGAGCSRNAGELNRGAIPAMGARLLPMQLNHTGGEVNVASAGGARPHE